MFLLPGLGREFLSLALSAPCVSKSQSLNGLGKLGILSLFLLESGPSGFMELAYG